MVSLFGILNIGARGINAAQAGLDTAGNNIANANTEGYSRQRIIQRSVDPLVFTNGAFGQGVDVINIERVKDMLLEGQINDAKSDQTFYEEMDKILLRIQSILNDPLTPISESADDSSAGGINNLLAQFFNAFHALSNTPEAPEVRSAAVESAQSLAQNLANVAEDFQVLQDDLNEQVKFFSGEVNRITSEISVLNRKISSTEGGSGVNANEFRDQRDLLVNELAGLLPIETIDNPNNTINITLAGQTLVDNTSTTPLILEKGDTQGNIDMVNIRVGEKGLIVVDDQLRKGKLGAILDARDRLVPFLNEQMDRLARGIINEVNKIHSAASGMEGYQTVTSLVSIPQNFLEPDTEVTLDRVFNNPELSSRQKLGNRPYPIQDGTFSIRVADKDNNTRDVFDIEVNTSDRLNDLVQRIDRSDGVVKTAQSAFSFDPVFIEKVQGKKGAADAAELAGPLSAMAALAGTPIAEVPGNYTFEIHMKDDSGSAIDFDPATSGTNPATITIDDTMTLQEVAAEIQSAGNGKIRAQLAASTVDPTVTVLRVEAIQAGSTVSFQNDNSGIVEAFDFPITDPTLPLVGGNATEVQTTFTGNATDSLLGAGSPQFNTNFSGPPPTVIGEGSFELVIIDNNNTPVIHTVTIAAGGIDTLQELETEIESFDTNVSVTITADNEFVITAANNRTFFFRNDTTGLVEAMGFSDINGFGQLGDQPFQNGSFEIVVANDSGTVTHVVEVPVRADSSQTGGVFTLNDLVDQINRSIGDFGAPLLATITTDPKNPTKNLLQIEASEGFEFTFRSDDSLLLSALGFTDGPVLQAANNKPIIGGDETVAVGDTIGGLVRARIVDNDRIEISTTDDDQLSFVGDTSHFLAAAEINALFTGTDAQTMRVNGDILDNSNLLGSSSDGMIGNNDAALAVTELEDTIVLNNMTLNEFYRSTIATLGIEGNRTRQSLQTSDDILRELKNLQEQDSGVSLDEESISIIRFQQAFQASARMISTVDRLIDLVINQIGA